MHDVLAQLAAAGTMPPLADLDGEPYPPEQLPCTTQPRRWDAEAPAWVSAVAVALCAGCPARWPCAARRFELDGLVSGVWAGEYIPEPAEPPAVYDAAVAAWLDRAGVVMKARP